MLETPETITAWANEQFGALPPLTTAARMNMEVAELLATLNNGREVSEYSPEEAETYRQHAIDECADIYIMLAQVACALRGDLRTAVNQKMEVNRRRVWKQTKNGTFQHHDGEA